MIPEAQGPSAGQVGRKSLAGGRKRVAAPKRKVLHLDKAKLATAVVSARHAAQHADIAREAYYRAERRGFTPGFELDDWLAAEAALNGGAPHASIDDPVGIDSTHYLPDHEI